MKSTYKYIKSLYDCTFLLISSAHTSDLLSSKNNNGSFVPHTEVTAWFCVCAFLHLKKTIWGDAVCHHKRYYIMLICLLWLRISKDCLAIRASLLFCKAELSKTVLWKTTCLFYHLILLWSVLQSNLTSQTNIYSLSLCIKKEHLRTEHKKNPSLSLWQSLLTELTSHATLFSVKLPKTYIAPSPLISDFLK